MNVWICQGQEECGDQDQEEYNYNDDEYAAHESPCDRQAEEEYSQSDQLDIYKCYEGSDQYDAGSPEDTDVVTAHLVQSPGGSLKYKIADSDAEEDTSQQTKPKEVEFIDDQLSAHNDDSAHARVKVHLPGNRYDTEYKNKVGYHGPN